MNNKYYHFLIDIINILLVFFVCFALIGMGLLFTTRSTEAVLGTLILLPAPFISHFCGRHLKHIWSFLALHIALIAVYAFNIHNIFAAVFYITYLLLLTAVALSKRLQPEKPGKTNTSIFLLSVFIIMYLVDSYLGITSLNRLLFILVTLFILLYLFNMYLINFEGYFNKHSNISDIPIRQIKNTNHILIVFFGCFCIVVMLIFTTLPLKEFLSAVGSLLLTVLRFLVSLFPSKNEEPAPPESAATEQGTPPLNLPDDNPPSVILEYIQNILLGLFTIAIIAGAIALVLYGLYRIYRLFYAKKSDTLKDITEFISPFDKRERIYGESEKKAGNRFFNPFSRSNNDKIRKLFFKAVSRQNKGEALSGSLTPVQLSEYALTGQFGRPLDKELKEKTGELAACYELARYGREECTKDDVLKVRNILKKTLS